MEEKRRLRSIRNYMVIALAAESVVTVNANIIDTIYSKLSESYSLIARIVIIVGVICLGICTICYFAAKDPRKADEAYTWGKRILGGMIAFIIFPKIVLWILELFGEDATSSSLTDLENLVGGK